MLKVNKTININGNSVINVGGQDVIVAYLSASIATNDTSNANTNISIVNQEFYKTHKREVRKDINDFEDKVYEVEDSLEAEKVKDKETEKKTSTEKQS